MYNKLRSPQLDVLCCLLEWRSRVNLMIGVPFAVQFIHNWGDYTYGGVHVGGLEEGSVT